MGKNKKRIIHYGILAFIAAITSGFFASQPLPVQALNEQYTWQDKNTIVGTGGRYGTIGVTYTASKSYTPGKDNTPLFNGERFDDPSGCFFTASLVFKGTATNSATLSPSSDSIPMANGCGTDITSKYDTLIILKGSPGNTTNTTKNRTITVTVQVPSGEAFSSDTVTMKEAGGKTIASKKTTGAATATSDGYIGYTVEFKGLVNTLSYQACSAIINKCGNAAALPITPTPADLLTANKILISKDPTTAANTTSCAVDGIGWIVCPILTFMAKANDSAFSFLQSFLAIRPGLINDPGTKNAWSAFRDIANVAFVIAFLVIVYSQLTSAGVSNYGIKKMLPRIVVAAILVNLSYYVCEIAVDISNIVGSSAYTLLKDSVNINANITATSPSWLDQTSNILAKAATGIFVVLLIILVIAAPISLLAFGLIILILIARQAFIILLVVMAPLAFVAYLLPNTEIWFKKWWKAFSTILMVYPIIGVVFGGSSLAANILSSAAAHEDDASLLQLTALGVMAIPLFAVPALLKGSLSAAGTIGARIQNMADKTQGRAAAKSKERFNESAAGQFLNYRGQVRQRKRALSRSGISTGSNRNPLNWGRNANAAIMSRVNTSSASGSFGDRLAAGGAELEDKMWDEEVKRQKTLITVGKNMSNEQILNDLAAGKGSAEYQAALGSVIMQRDHRESHLKALEITRQRNASAAEGSKESETVMGIQKQMAHDGGSNMPWAMGDQALGSMVEGKFGAAGHVGNTETLQEQLKVRVGKKLSVKTLATMNPDELKSVHKMARNGQLSATEMANLQAKITELRTDPQYKGMEKPEASVLFNELLAGSYALDPSTGTGSAHYNDSRVF